MSERAEGANQEPGGSLAELLAAQPLGTGREHQVSYQSNPPLRSNGAVLERAPALPPCPTRSEPRIATCSNYPSL